MAEKDSHCSYCGHKFDQNQSFPRTCNHCGNVTFRNPIPVVVVLVPVDSGLLLIRRGIEPQRGLLALPGGYIDLSESWQEAAVREVFEETGVSLQPQEVREFRVCSAPDGTLLIFGTAPHQNAADLPPFVANEETTERVILSQCSPRQLAFPLHAEVIHAFFSQKDPQPLIHNR